MSKRKHRFAGAKVTPKKITGLPSTRGGSPMIHPLTIMETSKVELRQQANALRRQQAELYDIINARVAVSQRLSKNGITPKDLEDEFKRGYDAARSDLTRMTMQFFYSAIAIATHRLFKFGETRIYRLLDAVQQIMCEEITTVDIRARCKEETGVDIIENEYDN